MKMAGVAINAMLWPTLFSRQLGLSEGVQWALRFGAVIPIWLIFVYNKKIKEEETKMVADGTLSARKIEDEQGKAMNRLMVIWICLVPFTMSFPFWLPRISGISLGFRGDVFVSIATLAIISLIFLIRIKKMANQPLQPTRPYGPRG
jgi:hypothetical protein